MIYDHEEYRKYLALCLAPTSSEKGARARLAKHLNCQTSFLSQVLTLRSHLSLEHALRVSDFLGHSAEERHFFMLLVQKAKAGSSELEAYYQELIAQVRAKRQVIRDHIRVRDELGFQEQVTYYSAWWYVAIHILCALPGTQTRDQIARRLSLPREIVDSALQFLLTHGLIESHEGRLAIGKRRIHLGSNSTLLPRHHANWRIKAAQSVDQAGPRDLHYSGVIGISKADGAKIRTFLLELLKNSETVIQDSKEDTAYVMLLDFFEL